MDTRLKEFTRKRDVWKKLYSLRYHELKFPTGFVIGKNRVIILIWGGEDTAIEIISRRIVKRYREFFERMWELSGE